MIRISEIATAPVKGFALAARDEVYLGKRGVVDNRRFFLVDGDGRRLRSSLTPWPVVVSATYDEDREELTMRFPDGRELTAGAAGGDETVRCIVSNGTVEARLVPGPWTAPLSELAGHPVRVVRPELPGASLVAPVTFVSRASLERLAEEAGRAIDSRRFRMLFTIDGCGAHEEDEWDGRTARVGEALVRFGGPIERCAVTTRDPDTGTRDLDTLRLIKNYRGMPRKGKIDFGVYADVVEPGLVRVGDSVELA
jgi:MOSC domain-containing protein